MATPFTDFASDPAAGFGSPVYTRLPEVIERKDSLRAQQSQVGPARPLHVPGLTRTTSEARVESIPRGSGQGGDGRGGGGVRRRQGCAEHDDDASLCPKRIVQGRPCVYDEGKGKCRLAGYPIHVPANARQHSPNVKPKKRALLQPATTRAMANANRFAQNGVRPRRDCSMLDHNASLCVKRHFRGHRCVYDESKGRCAAVDLVAYAARLSPASSRNAPLGKTKPRATVMPLQEQVAMLKRELAVSGTLIEVVHRSARHLGIKQESDLGTPVPLRQLAARCIEMLGL